MAHRVVVIGAGFGGIGMAIRLKQAGIRAAGVEVTYTRWPRMWHDFMLQPGMLAAADSAVAQAAWFVGAVTATA